MRVMCRIWLLSLVSLLSSAHIAESTEANKNSYHLIAKYKLKNLGRGGWVTPVLDGTKSVDFYLSENGTVFSSDNAGVDGKGEGGLVTPVGVRGCAENRSIQGYVVCLTVNRTGGRLKVRYENVFYYQGVPTSHDVSDFVLTVNGTDCKIKSFKGDFTGPDYKSNILSVTFTSCVYDEGHRFGAT
ncbi:hypothetical protein [Methylobacterium sp. D48H]